MLFVVTAYDRENAGDLRAATRPAHLAYLEKSGVVKLAGPLLDSQDKVIGSLLILDVADLAAAQKLAAEDPYAKAGLFARSDVHAWRAPINNCNAAL